MDMRMVMQGLPPSMKHGDEPELGAGMLWIGGNDAQCLSHCSEEDGVDGRLILERDLGHRRRHGEDDVEIGDRQQLGLPICQPLGAGLPLTLRTVPISAGIVSAAHRRRYQPRNPPLGHTFRQYASWNDNQLFQRPWPLNDRA
jgi:hypothetical protein